MCLLSMKMPIWKKFGNWFKDPRIYRISVVYWTAGQTTKNSLIYKHTIYIFIFRWSRVWSRNTVRDTSHISFFCDGDAFSWSSVTAGEHTWYVCLRNRRSLLSLESPADLSPSLEWPAGSPFAWVSSRSLHFAWATSGSPFFSSKLQTLYSPSSPKGKYEHPLCLTYFLFIAGYRNLHTSVISGNLFIFFANGNICHSIH